MQNRAREQDKQGKKKRSLHLKINPRPTEQQQYVAYNRKPWAKRARVLHQGRWPVRLTVIPHSTTHIYMH
jgi:hypothetical protein